MADRKLTPKQEAFVREYPAVLDATEAARRAGYSEKTAGQVGYQLLQKTSIREALAEQLRQREQRTLVNADRVVNELALVAFSDVGQIIDFTGADARLRPACEIPGAARRAISSVKVRRFVDDRERVVEVTEFKLWNKIAALAKLLEHLGPPPPPPPPVNVNVFPSSAAVVAFLATLAAREVDSPLREDAPREPGLPAPRAAP